MAIETVLKPTLHHVTLKTTRLREMIDWYVQVVGLRPTYRFEGGAWLTNDAANHRLALLTHPSLTDDPDKLAHSGITTARTSTARWTSCSTPTHASSARGSCRTPAWTTA